MVRKKLMCVMCDEIRHIDTIESEKDADIVLMIPCFDFIGKEMLSKITETLLDMKVEINERS